jgi:hypothetical protein
MGDFGKMGQWDWSAIGEKWEQLTKKPLVGMLPASLKMSDRLFKCA